MKKSLFKEYEVLIRSHMSEIYAKAYAVKGNRAEAEALTEDAIVWGASKFSGLANKERVLDLILERIGNGTYEGMEPTDEEKLLSRAMERIRGKGKLRSLVLGVGSCVLALAILGVSLPQLPYDEWFPEETTTQTDAEGNVVQPVIGAVTMKKTDTIKGDNEKITLENYHDLSDFLDKKTVGFDGNDTHSKLERYVATVTAPDGTAYLAFTDMPRNDSADNNTVTLYRMEKDGWTALGSCEAQVNYATGNIWASDYQASRIYLETDADSNVYLFCFLDNAIVVHKYDCKTGAFTEEASLPTIYKPRRNYSFSTQYVADVGERGAIYVGYQEYTLRFAYYDIAKGEFVLLSEEIKTSPWDRKLFVKDGVIHIVERDSSGVLRYCRVNQDGTVSKKVLYTREGTWDSESIANRGNGAGGITVDENGIVHIIATRSNGDNTFCTVHYTVTEDLTVEKEILPKLYYTESDTYQPRCGGLTVDQNGGIYYLETYRYGDSQNLLSIAKLSGAVGEAPTLVDVIEIPHNITIGFMILRDETVVFFSDHDIYYFECKGMGD